MATVQELYRDGKYREIVEMVSPDWPRDDTQVLILGWAYHQLGEYVRSVPIMRLLRVRYGPDTEIGDSARRGLAHGLQQIGQIEEANAILSELLLSLARDNVRAVTILQETRNGAPFPIAEVQQMISRAMWTVPRQANNNGHIVNNLTYAMYMGRNQDAVKPFLSMLPGLIEVAIGIYEEVKAQKNHRAACLGRASEIFLDVVDWAEGAKVVILESIKLWEELRMTEEGERYQGNLEGARAHLRKIEERHLANRS